MSNAAMTAGVRYCPTMIPQALSDAIVDLLPEGKRRVRLDGIDRNAASGLLAFIPLLIRELPAIRINTAIQKRYRSGDQSGAYVLHRDPEEFMSEPLILATITGCATLTVEADNQFYSIQTSPGDVIILENPFLRHFVSSPIGERHFLFLGFSTALSGEAS